VVLLEAESHIPWVAVVTLLAHWLKVDLIELGLHCHLLVARGTSKVVDAPGLIECCEHISLDNLVAHLAKVPKQLVVVGLTIGKALPLIVPVSKEGLLALKNDKQSRSCLCQMKVKPWMIYPKNTFGLFVFPK